MIPKQLDSVHDRKPNMIGKTADRARKKDTQSEYTDR